MPIIQVPVLGAVEFPDDMTQEQIEAAIQQLIGPPKEYSKLETFGRNIEREAIGIYENVGDWLKPYFTPPADREPTPPQDNFIDQMTQDPGSFFFTPMSEEALERNEKDRMRKEIAARVAAEQNPVSGIGGRMVGGLVGSPITPLPLAATTLRGGAALGGLVGGIEGLISPLYPEFGDPSRATVAALGTGLGAGLGTGAVGLSRWLGRKFGQDQAVDASKAVESAAVESASAAKPRYRGVVDPETGQVSYKLVEPEDLLNEVPIPTKAIDQEVAEVVQNVVDVNTLPKLPEYLQGATPRFAKSEIGFETDLDKALYIVANPSTKSKRHDEYVQYLQQALNKSEQEVLDLGKQVRKEVVDAGKLAQKEGAIKGLEIDRINFGLSRALDNVVNPIEKNLDELSKLVYNYGKELPTSPSGKLMIRANDPRVDQLEALMKGIDSNYTRQDAVMAAKGYSQMLQKLKEIDGKNFTVRSFDDFVKNKEKNNDLMIKLYNAGEMDGC